MFHNDIQTSLTNHWKRSDAEHPVDKVCAGHFADNRQTRQAPSKPRSSQYKSTTKHIIQRQQVIRSFLSKSTELESSPRKPIILDTQPTFLSITSISSSQPPISESNDTSTNNNNRPQKYDRPSPLLARRARLTIENPSPHSQVADLSNVSGLQLSLSIPSNLTLRQRPPRVTLSDRSTDKTHGRISSPRIRPSKYPKLTSETRLNPLSPKSPSYNSFLLTPTWTPTIVEQEAMHSRTSTDILRSKPQPARTVSYRHPQIVQSERVNSDLKPTDIEDLHISSPLATSSLEEFESNTDAAGEKELRDDEWDCPKSSNDDESTSTDENSSTSTCRSQADGPLTDHEDLSTSATFIGDRSQPKSQDSSTKPKTRRRRAYNAPLPPVVEHLDEETDLARILEKISALRKKEFNDEDSFTFQLLNQQETAFEKTLSKRRKLLSKQN